MMYESALLQNAEQKKLQIALEEDNLALELESPTIIGAVDTYGESYIVKGISLQFTNEPHPLGILYPLLSFNTGFF